MNDKPAAEPNSAGWSSAEPRDLIARAAFSARSCGAALDQGDQLTAAGFLGDLRELIGQLERVGAGGRAEVRLLREQGLRLSRSLFSSSAEELEPTLHSASRPWP